MSVLTDAVYLRRWEFVGTPESEWSFLKIEDDGAQRPAMLHIPSMALFVIASDETPPEEALPRCAVLVSNGNIDPRDHTAFAYLGRGAVWFYLRQIPEIQAILDERAWE